VAGLFKSLFGRGGNRTLPPISPPRPSAAHEPPQVRNIVVPARTVAVADEQPTALVQAVVGFVNYMADECFFNPDELPKAAMQAYHVEDYTAQIANGGMGQFLHDSAMSESMFAHIESGLEAMECDAHADVFLGLRAWADENRQWVEEADLSSGFRPPELEELMRQYEEAGGDAVIHRASADWLRGLKELRPVADDQFGETMRAAQQLNPLVSQRQTARRIARIERDLEAPIHQALRMAALRCSPEEIVLQMGGAMTEEVDGVPTRVWTCRTNAGLRGGVIEDEGAALYAYVEHTPMTGPPPAPGESWEDAFERAAEDTFDAYGDGRPNTFERPTLGQKVGEVSRAELDHAREFCQLHQAAAAIDLVMQRSHPGLEPLSIAPTIDRGDDGHERGTFLVHCGHEPLVMTVWAQGAGLMSPEPGSTDLAVTVTRTEIATHAHEAEPPQQTAAR